MKKYQNRYYLNDGWMFSEQFTEDMKEEGFCEDHMEHVRLPHTCKMLPFHYINAQDYQMISGYRMHFQGKDIDWNYGDNSGSWQCEDKVKDEDKDKDKDALQNQIAGTRYFLTFEGAAHEATVYLNGTELLVHRCGYTAFTIDITDVLRMDGDNLLVVRLDSRESLNQPPFGHVIDYMTYGGLYREVYIEARPELYLQDIFVHTENVLSRQKNIISDLTLSVPESFLEKADQRSDTPKQQDHNKKLEVELSLLDHAGNTLQQFGKEQIDMADHFNHDNDSIAISRQSVRIRLTNNVSDVQLWDLDNPALYQLNVKLRLNGTMLEERIVRFGFRSTEFKSDGFYLNGKKIKLRGINRHQSYPYTGYAMPKSMQCMDADVIRKELGFNAVRTSHYPQSQYFLDRCDELGLLVFTEIPGWQHVGNQDWKEVLCYDVEEMVLQYRNHPSIILWGVRVNESQDDDELYTKTNKIAHELDATRQTAGVRYLQKSSLLEDVYTYNDFKYDGTGECVEQKSKVTPDMQKAYLISEFNGHMFPTKSFDPEKHRLEHAIRHAKVVNAYYEAEDIAGGFAWCLFDYNTHKDFGSGDNICYHGITDSFRNPKMAAAVYEAFSEKDFLEVSNAMDIGEHPASRLGDIYLFTNADSVRFYKNGTLIKEYPCRNENFKGLEHPPIYLDDMIGSQLMEQEGYSEKKSEDVKQILFDAARLGMNHIPISTKWKALKLMLFGGMRFSDAYSLYGKYVGDWGNVAKSYTFEAVKNRKVVKTVVKEPVQKVSFVVKADHTCLVETSSYDVAAIRILAVDQNENVLAYYNEPIQLSVQGELELIGPSVTSLRGGMGGTYVKTTGKAGKGTLTILNGENHRSELEFTISIETGE